MRLSTSITEHPSFKSIRGWKVGTTFPIDHPVMIMGRDANCQITLGSMDVSRKHARLVAYGEDYFVEDLGSTHGTLLNGEALVGPALLKHGDLIQMGDCVLSFADPSGKEHGRYDDATRILRSRDSSPTGEWALAGFRPEEKLRAILEIGRDLIGPLDFDEVLRRTLDAVFRLFPNAERGFVILQEDDEFLPRAVKLRDDQSTHRAPSRTVLSYAIGAGKAILSEDLQGDMRFDGARSIDDAGLRTLMCVPLRDHTRQCVGAIQIDTSDPLARFTTDDLDLLVAVAGQLSMAVDNARLHRTVQESLRQQIEIQGFVDSMLASAPIAMAFLDPQFRYVRVNHALAQLNGKSINEHLGRGIGEIGDVVATCIEPIVRSVAESKVPATGVEVICNGPEGTGKPGHWLCNCYPASGPDGEPLGFGIILEDVADARRAEEALRNSEQRYRLLFDANPAPMWVYDVQTLRFLAVNQAAIQRYGYSREEFLAMTIADIRPRDDVDSLLKRVSEIQQAASLNATGWRHITKSGEMMDVEISSHSIAFAGRPARLVLASDITLRVKAEAAVLAAKESAEAANRAKDRFLAVLSHELRTPLTPVLLAVTGLLEDASTRSKHQATIEMIRRNVEIEARLVDDLLDVAKIERGNLRLELGPVDIHSAIREAMDICQPEIASSGLQLEFELTAKSYYAMADSGRIRQVFWNLIRNATKYTSAPGSLRVRTWNEASASTMRGGERLVIEFEDTGVGIEPELLTRIFEPFEQGELTGRSRDGGLGLGLAISRSIVQEHGGQLTAQSRGRGKGATFRVELGTIAKPVPVAVAPAAPVSLHGTSLLIVEDNEDTRRFLELVLRTLGLDVTSAKDLSAARASLADRSFDLLLSDIELPDGTGLELMHELAGVETIRGIAMSGFGSADDVSASLRAGFVEHMTKPIRVDALQAAISRALGLRDVAASA